MNDTHTERLFEEAPLLYRDRYAPPSESLMCYGFNCRDGWFDVLCRLSTLLEGHLAFLHKNGTPVDELPAAVQVKEKYGGLRFYVSGSDGRTAELIADATEKAWQTCEYCGEVGKLRTDRSWIRTLCDECSEETWVSDECCDPKEDKTT